jgi:PAS domain S-box-containing protein
MMHPECLDRDCGLRRFWQRSSEVLVDKRHAESDAWDPVLQKHCQIRVQLPDAAIDQDAALEELFHFFAVVAIADVTAAKASEADSRQAERILTQRVEDEEKKRVEAEKVQSHLLTILDKAPVFTAMADRTGALFYLNPAARSLMGLGSKRELTGMTLAGCQAPSERLRFAEEALPVAARDGVWSGDSMLLGRDGTEVRAYLTLIADRDEDNNLEGFSLLGRDMSEWVRTEEALRSTRKELWRLAAQHLTIQESERRRIAMDLHDGLGQTLGLVKLSIEEAARSLGASGSNTSDTVAATLGRLGPTVKTALDELRRISMNLRPSTLDDLGILATLSWYFREFEGACPGIRIESEISVAEADVPNTLKIAIFRIVQEATGNALKHSKAGVIKVRLRNRKAGLELAVEDDGQGFDPAAVAGGRDFTHGLGLQSMRERAELSGGEYQFRSAPGLGTSLRVRWPLLKTWEDKLPGGLKAHLAPFLRKASLPSQEVAAEFPQLACVTKPGGHDAANPARSYSR